MSQEAKPLDLPAESPAPQLPNIPMSPDDPFQPDFEQLIPVTPPDPDPVPCPLNTDRLKKGTTPDPDVEPE